MSILLLLLNVNTNTTTDSGKHLIIRCFLNHVNIIQWFANKNARRHMLTSHKRNRVFTALVEIGVLIKRK